MREIVIEPRHQRAGDVFVEALDDQKDPRIQHLIRVRRNEPNPPPLPLAHGSVVYAEIGEQWGEWFLTQHGTWTQIEGFAHRHSSAELHDRLTRFHVISEPRPLIVHEIAEYLEHEQSDPTEAANIRSRFLPGEAVS